jgi:hypothetical protein
MDRHGVRALELTQASYKTDRGDEHGEGHHDAVDACLALTDGRGTTMLAELFLLGNYRAGDEVVGVVVLLQPRRGV